VARSIHRRDTPEGPRYRVWSSIVDAYLCDPLGREGIVEWLRANEDPDRYPGETDARLARADAQGTSLLGRNRPMSTWEVERCEGCGGFHHALTDTCCDDAADDPCHGPACEATP
jgi:hypothetical protein